MTQSFVRALVARRGDRRWDYAIYSLGGAALLAIPILLVFPRSVTLVWLGVLSIPANGPLSPIVPAAFEPLIMEAAKFERPIWVTLVALGVYLYMEYLNWHIYGWVLDREVFARLRTHRWVQTGVDWFKRGAFTTIVVFAFTPLPFWAVRSVAIVAGYPLGKFMVATTVGRFPRLYLYAWLGAALRVPTLIIIGIILGTTLAAIALKVGKGQAIMADQVVDAPHRPAATAADPASPPAADTAGA